MPVICAEPALPAMVGFVKTARLRSDLPSQEAPGVLRERRLNYYRYVADGGYPCIIVIEDFGDIKGLGAFPSVPRGLKIIVERSGAGRARAAGVHPPVTPGQQKAFLIRVRIGNIGQLAGETIGPHEGGVDDDVGRRLALFRIGYHMGPAPILAATSSSDRLRRSRAVRKFEPSDFRACSTG